MLVRFPLHLLAPPGVVRIHESSPRSIDHVPFSICDYNGDEQFPLTKQDGSQSVAGANTRARAVLFPLCRSADNEGKLSARSVVLQKPDRSKDSRCILCVRACVSDHQALVVATLPLSLALRIFLLSPASSSPPLLHRLPSRRRFSTVHPETFLTLRSS